MLPGGHPSDPTRDAYIVRLLIASDHFVDNAAVRAASANMRLLVFRMIVDPLVDRTFELSGATHELETAIRTAQIEALQREINADFEHLRAINRRVERNLERERELLGGIIDSMILVEGRLDEIEMIVRRLLEESGMVPEEGEQY